MPELFVGMYLGGMVPVILDLMHDYRTEQGQDELPNGFWPVVLFVLGWPLAAVWCAVELWRDRP